MMLKSPFYRAAILLPLLLSLAGVAPSSLSGQNRPQPTGALDAQMRQQARMDSLAQEGSSPTISPEQRRKSDFEKMKRDVDELADLVKALQEELKKANENILSRGIVDKADKIGKLAKKIKGTAQGF